jgi:hypothetical protein
VIVLAALALLAAADPPRSIDGLPVGGLPRQALPARGCAAYLFTTGPTRALVAMATADPAQIRIALDGRIADFARAAQVGDGGFGFARTTTYAAADTALTLDLTIATRADLRDGAVVPEATIRIERAGRDGIVLPVAGMIGCA